MEGLSGYAPTGLDTRYMSPRYLLVMMLGGVMVAMDVVKAYCSDCYEGEIVSDRHGFLYCSHCHKNVNIKVVGSEVPSFVSVGVVKKRKL